MKRITVHSQPLKTELRRYIRAKRAASDPALPWQADFLDRLLPFSTAGKLLRGSLLCFTYEAFAKRPADRGVRRAALALELAHSALLIHDDIMDNDPVRRGQPSLHYQYQQVGTQQRLAATKQFGVNMALCGGDSTLFMAFELLSDTSNDPSINQKVQRLFTDCLATVCAGQMQDVSLEAQPTMPSKRAIYDFMKAKTASYTLTLPLTMGASLAGQSNASLRQLTAIGNAAGTIFQIRDDELGALGNSHKTGKPVGADIREGKKTLLYYYLLKSCSAAERKHLKTIFGNPNSASEDIATVQRLMRHYRIPQLLNRDVKTLEQQTSKTLKKLQAPATFKTELRQLIRFCAQRQT